jgi:ribosomal protein S18 acetylase RimI-like enzyme
MVTQSLMHPSTPSVCVNMCGNPRTPNRFKLSVIRGSHKSLPYPRTENVNRQCSRLETCSYRDEIDGSTNGRELADLPTKFVKFSTPAAASLVQKLSSFRKEYNVSDDPSRPQTLVIAPLTNQYINPTADILTEAFGDAMGYLNTYQRFLRNQIGDYLANHIRLLPKALILVALLEDRVTGQSQTDAQAGGASSSHAQTLVGTVEVSFHPSTRSAHLTLNPPSDMPYLCNMAVQQEFRGQGYGSLLLDAAEEVVLSTGYKSLYLHVRHADPPAVALYRKYGYVEEGEDMGIVKIFGLDQRYLMKKFLERHD